MGQDRHAVHAAAVGHGYHEYGAQRQNVRLRGRWIHEQDLQHGSWNQVPPRTSGLLLRRPPFGQKRIGRQTAGEQQHYVFECHACIRDRDCHDRRILARLAARAKASGRFGADHRRARISKHVTSLRS